MLRLEWLSHARTRPREMLALLWLFFLQEFVDDLFYVAVLAVDGVVQLTHIVVGYFSSEFVEGLFYFWMCGQRFLANDRNGFVGREIMFVVVEDGQVEGWNQAIGVVAGDQIDLLVS
jgi:hypothetical protein